jgi:Zn-dependent protease
MSLNPQFLLLFVPVLLLALTLHEFAHAWTAARFGDPTPQRAGRLSLNPLKHLDPLGTLFLLVAHFGWAKPVPVNPRYFTHPRAELWVSLAGIIANLLQAVLYAAIWHLFLQASPMGELRLVQGLVVLGVMLNLSLALFNLLPIFPLDGSHVLTQLLPRAHAFRFRVFSERYGAMILLALLALGYVSDVSPLQVLIGIPRNWLAGLLLQGF